MFARTTNGMLHPFYPLVPCGDGCTFVQTQYQAAYRGGVESGRAGSDGGREQGYL